jgi:hypothetical protein
MSRQLGSIPPQTSQPGRVGRPGMMFGVMREPGLVVSMRLVAESFAGVRASWLGGSLVRSSYRDVRP